MVNESTTTENILNDQILFIDKSRYKPDSDPTGIYVRGLLNNQWISTDMYFLDVESTLVWLRSRGGANLWAENLILLLLGHRQVEADEVKTLMDNNKQKSFEWHKNNK